MEENSWTAKRKAPVGKFRVIGEDNFSYEDWVAGDFQTLDEAKSYVEAHPKEMQVMLVYDDQGKELYKKKS